MTPPRKMKRISEEYAYKVIDSHPEGEWNGMFMNSDFIYEGMKLKDGYRKEMIRVCRVFGRNIYIKGIF